MGQKGVFPYSFVDSIDKMNNSKLPTKNEFYNNLRDKHISDESYERAKSVWNMFGCKNLGEYSDLYQIFCYYVMFLSNLEISVLMYIN